MSRIRLLAPPLLLGCVWLLTGCQVPEHTPTIRPESDWDAIMPACQYRVIGRSVRGCPILAKVYGHGDDVTLFIGTIHGNEPAGTPLLDRLGKHLENNRQLLQGRTVVIIPVANPDGKADKTRHNVRGVDLNRNFPAANRQNNQVNGPGGLSEPESLAIYQVIRTYRPDRIIALHQPLSCIDYDGPAEVLAKRIARTCELPVKKLGARPGSLGSYAGETQGIPVITMEMHKGDSWLSDTQLWINYGASLLAAINSPQRPHDVWQAR